MNKGLLFQLKELQKHQLNDLLKLGQRDVPNFFEVSEDIYIPVEGGEIHCYHHKPENPKAKRPIIFIPGYISNPRTWVDFFRPHLGLAESFYLETREKRSSKFIQSKTVDFSVDRCSQDLVQAIEYLGLKSKDYYLHGSSFGATAALWGMAKGYFNPPTISVYDPMIEWIMKNKLVLAIMKILSPRMINILKSLAIRFFTMKEKDEAQKKRMRAFAEVVEGWKVKYSLFQNKDFEMYCELQNIKQEVFVFTGHLDRYHPPEICYEHAKSLPQGRFFYLETEPTKRALLSGVISRFFAFRTKEEGVPPELLPFEITIDRE